MTDFTEPCPTCEGTGVPLSSSKKRWTERNACPDCHEGRVPAKCGRLLVGQGDDTSDPLCLLPVGHVGLCSPS